ncbi:unnamed protein product [Rodentolepis nana]|uniref:FGGY_N domain-containing protein n=1 Tax=Rodentolepis nana TaxID=102285 RepID=A0A0R3TBI2_RODNA|nr:unnamed protein product [Rodentolepis nana]
MQTDENGSPENCILAVDFGSTHAFARIYNDKCENLAESVMSSKTTDPEVCWTVMNDLFEDVLKRACVRPIDLNGLGISVQRNTFLLWNRETSLPVTRLSTWQENTASSYASNRNNSHFLYEKCRKGELVFGCLETWLLWRLTGGRAWCTDASCSSASGAFDPSIVRCGPLADIGNDSSKSSSRRVRVTALIGDSQAAMLGEGCLNVGDAKLTLGTGSFLCVNIGSSLVPPNTGE